MEYKYYSAKFMYAFYMHHVSPYRSEAENNLNKNSIYFITFIRNLQIKPFYKR